MCWEPLIFVTITEPKYSSAEARIFDFPDFLLTVPANDYLLKRFLYTYWKYIAQSNYCPTSSVI